MPILHRLVLALAVTVGAAACATGSGPATSEAAMTAEPEPTAEPTTEPTLQVAATPVSAAAPTPIPVEPSAAAPELGVEASVFEIVSWLASDELMGRDNQTPGSELAQAFLIDQLALISDPAAPAEGHAGYRFDYDRGINLIGVIRGTDLADEYVMVGAHYDHVGTRCRGNGSSDNICNGAADNAAGVAAAIAVARSLAEQHSRRSVIIALWDGEEDGLIGTRRYVRDPVVPLAQTVAYINFDIQGADLSPALAGTTIMIGAESGGQTLIDAALAATADSPLDVISFNLIFGQGRSDHAQFAVADVPIVFFTDATNGCYHTVADDVDALNFTKLDHQIDNATRLAIDLASSETAPQFDPDAPLTTFDDAVNLLRLVTTFEPDFAWLGAVGEADSKALLVALREIVAAGPEAYVGPVSNTVLGGVARLVEQLANTPCLASAQ